MLDLFYTGSFEDQLKTLRKDLKAYALGKGYDYGKKRIYIAFGNKEYVGDNILFVAPPIKAEGTPFKNKPTTRLVETAQQFGIEKFFITSCYLIPQDRASRADIKAFNPWMLKIIELLQPKAVVVLGEDAEFVFFKRKFILRDHHGKVIGKVGELDVMLSYPMQYYYQRSEFEDPSYKLHLRDLDWKAIQELYNMKIGE